MALANPAMIRYDIFSVTHEAITLFSSGAFSMGDRKLSKKISEKIEFFTIVQWQAIDSEYRQTARFDWKAFAVFSVICFVLITGKYICRTSFIESFQSMRELFHSMRNPGLYPELYWAIGSALNYLLFPAIIIKYIFKERIRDYGFKWSKSNRILVLYAVMFVLVFILALVFSHTDAFQRKYPFYKSAANSWTEFLIWELSYAVQFFMLEFFFRGFILFTLARYLGSLAVFVMTVPYVMLHFTKPLPEACGAIFAGIALGTLALRTKSIYGGVVLHVSIALSMDIFTLFHRGELQRLF